MSRRCECPVRCKFCGAKIKRDIDGHFCPSDNCQWSHAVDGCTWYTTVKK